MTRRARRGHHHLDPAPRQDQSQVQAVDPGGFHPRTNRMTRTAQEAKHGLMALGVIGKTLQRDRPPLALHRDGQSFGAHFDARKIILVHHSLLALGGGSGSPTLSPLPSSLQMQAARFDGASNSPRLGRRGRGPLYPAGSRLIAGPQRRSACPPNPALPLRHSEYNEIKIQAQTAVFAVRGPSIKNVTTRYIVSEAAGGWNCSGDVSSPRVQGKIQTRRSLPRSGRAPTGVTEKAADPLLGQGSR
jgi:hypothetical protein